MLEDLCLVKYNADSCGSIVVIVIFLCKVQQRKLKLF